MPDCTWLPLFIIDFHCFAFLLGEVVAACRRDSSSWVLFVRFVILLIFAYFSTFHLKHNVKWPFFCTCMFYVHVCGGNMGCEVQGGFFA